MRRTSRRYLRAGRATGSSWRLSQAVLALVIVFLVYDRARDPQTWRWMKTDNGTEAEQAAGEPAEKPDSDAPKLPAEALFPGPTDADPEEWEACRMQLQAVTDKRPLMETDMPAYWRMFRWIRAQSFADAEKRALSGVRINDFYAVPDQYRGKLVRLRLHLRRVLSYPAPKNSAGVKTVYEYYGRTDQSQTWPYIMVTSELPPGIPLGDKVKGETVFVGYFLKTMSYDAFKDKLAAPLLVGRMMNVETSAKGPAAVGPAPAMDWLWIGLAAGACAMFAVFWSLRPAKRSASIATSVSPDEPDFANLFPDPPTSESQDSSKPDFNQYNPSPDSG